MAERRSRDKFLAVRVRSAICLALADAEGRPMRLAEIAAAVARMGLPLGARPTKTVSDALRWEVRRQRVLRWGRGQYRLGRIPPHDPLLYARARPGLRDRRHNGRRCT